MTKAQMTARETATVTFSPVEGAEGIEAITATVIRGNVGGSKVYQIFTADEVGDEAKSMSGAFSKFCEAINVVSKNYIVPGVKDVDFVDPNKPSDDWHDYDGAAELGEQIKKLAAERDTHVSGVRVANVNIARTFVKAEALLVSGTARGAWLDAFFPEGRNNSDASELRKLGNWPEELIAVCPKRYQSPKGFDKWLLEQRGELAEQIAQKATPEGKESITLKSLGAAFKAVAESIVRDVDKAAKADNGTDPAAIVARKTAEARQVLFDLHAENINRAGGIAKAVVISDEGVVSLAVQSGMKTPVCSAIIANYSDKAGDELLSSVVTKINNMPTKEEADAAGRAQAERNRTKGTAEVIKEAKFSDLDPHQAALHLFNIACSHEQIGDIAKVFSELVERLASGVPASAILEGLTSAEAEEADEDEAAAAEDAA